MTNTQKTIVMTCFILLLLNVVAIGTFYSLKTKTLSPLDDPALWPENYPIPKHSYITKKGCHCKAGESPYAVVDGVPKVWTVCEFQETVIINLQRELCYD